MNPETHKTAEEIHAYFAAAINEKLAFLFKAQEAAIANAHGGYKFNFIAGLEKINDAIGEVLTESALN